MLLALLPLAAGGVLVGVHSTQRDADGFYASGANPLSTSTHALVSDTLDVGTDGPDWLFRKGRLGTIRVTAEGTADKPIFVGIARQSQIDSYLQRRRPRRDQGLRSRSVHGHDRPSAGRIVSRETRRARTSGHESATGTGRQSIVWQVKKGDWAVVVMNADGSRGVPTDITVGAKLDLLLWLGIALLAIGAILLLRRRGDDLRRHTPSATVHIGRRLPPSRLERRHELHAFTRHIDPRPRKECSLMSIDPVHYARRWKTLGVLSLSLVIIGLDNTILNVALPTLQHEFDASPSKLQWMVDSYLLVFAGLLLVFGTLGDRFGRKRALQAGISIFGLASLGALDRRLGRTR